MHEFIRKLIHIIVGLGIAVMIFVLDHTSAVTILAAGLFLGIVCIDLILRGYTLPVISPILSYVDRHDPLPGKGAFYFAVSTFTCVILFPAPVVVPAIVSWALLDGVAAIAGIQFGRTLIYKGKSLEGTGTGIFVTFPALVLFMPFYGALTAAVIAGILEMFSPVDDNLIIPVGICILLTLIPVFV
jgi:dolichol kinase